MHTRKNKLFLLAAKDHPLTRQDEVRLADLNPYPLIGLSHDIGQAGKTNAEISKNRLKAPDYYLNSSDRDLIMRLVQSGLAVSFNAGWQYTEYPGIVALPLADMHVEVQLHVLLRNDVAVNSSIQRLIDYIENFSG